MTTTPPHTFTRFDHLGRKLGTNTLKSDAKETPVMDPSKPTISAELYDRLTNDPYLDPQDLELALDAARRGDIATMDKIVAAAHARLAPIKARDAALQRTANRWRTSSTALDEEIPDYQPIGETGSDASNEPIAALDERGATQQANELRANAWKHPSREDF